MSRGKKRFFEIKNKRRFLIIFWSVIVLPVLAVIVIFGLIASGSFGTLPTFEELENPRSNLATDIISEDGQLLGSLFVENRSFVDYDDLSPYLVAALVSTEDARFYSTIPLHHLNKPKATDVLPSEGAGSTIGTLPSMNLPNIE